MRVSARKRGPKDFTDLHIMHIVADFIAVFFFEEHIFFPGILCLAKTLLLLNESELCGAGRAAGICGEK